MNTMDYLFYLQFSVLYLFAATEAEVLPQFGQSETNVTFIEGETAILPCDVTSIGTYKVAWSSDDLVLTYTDRVIVDDPRLSVKREEHIDHSLIIRNVNKDDQGVYTCKVNTSPIREKLVHLKVTVFQPAQVLPGRSSSNLKIIEFGSATLVCQADGNPIPSITWKIRTFSEPSPGVICDVVPFKSDNCPTPLMHVVHILNVTRHCAGIYECVASNGEIDTHAIQIDVIEQHSAIVTVSTPLVTVARGSSTFLRCHATVTGFVQNHVTISWSKDGQHLTDNSKYKTVTTLQNGQYVETVLGIGDIEDNDYGEYICSAELAKIGVWTGNATVEKSPVITTNGCQPVNIDVCSGLPYTTTNYPNTMQAGHFSQMDVLDMMFTLAQTAFNSEHQCMKGNRFFRCAMLVPPCTSSGDIALPCRRNCEIYKNMCFSSYSMTWHQQWECDRLPDQGDCISQGSMDALNTNDGKQPLITFLPPFIEQAHGGNAVIQCIANIYPFGAFYFEKDGTPFYNSPTSTDHKVEFNSEGHYSYALLLHLKEMVPSDFGAYKCVAKNSFGVSVKEVHVNGVEKAALEDVPNISTNTSTVKSVIGQTASLYFTLTLPRQGSEVLVKKDNITVKSSSRVHVDKVHLQGYTFVFALKLLNLSDEDQGIYTLQMTIGSGVITQDAKLLVGVTPRVTMDTAFKFISQEKFEANFKCEIHYGKNNYRWKLQKDGETIEDNVRIMVNIRNRPKKQTDILTVSIWEFTEEDAGRYTCVATNLHGRAQANIVLHAATVPQVNISRGVFTPESGPDQVTLSCTVKAYPIAEVFWTKGSISGDRISVTRPEQVEQQVDEMANTVTSILSMVNTNSNDPEVYFCIGKNAVGKEHMSFVETPPVRL